MLPPSRPEQLSEKYCPDIRLPLTVASIPPEPPLEQLKANPIGDVLGEPEIVPLALCVPNVAVHVPNTVIRPC